MAARFLLFSFFQAYIWYQHGFAIHNVVMYYELNDFLEAI